MSETPEEPQAPAPTPKKRTRAKTTKPKTEAKPKVKINRVGACNDCGNEWIARNGGDAKPSKCPACGSYNCVWRDEKPREEPKSEEPAEPEKVTVQSTPEPQQEPAEQEPEPAKEEKPKPEEKKPKPMKQAAEEYSRELDKISQTLPKSNPQSWVLLIGVIAAAGAIFFLIRSGKISLPRSFGKVEEPPKQEQEPQQAGGDTPVSIRSLRIPMYNNMGLSLNNMGLGGR